MTDRARDERGTPSARRAGSLVAGAALLAAVACGGDPPTGTDGEVRELNLAVGESAVVEGGSDGLRFALPGPGGDGAEYRLAVHSAARTTGSTPMRLSIEAATGSASSAPAPGGSGSLAPGAGRRATGPAVRALGGADAANRGGVVERTRLQRQTREMLVRRGVRPARGGGAGGDGVRTLRTSHTEVAEGDTITLKFPVFEEDDESFFATCDSARTVEAEVKAVGMRAAMVEDTATSDLGSMNMDYQALANEFDDLVFGVDVAYFGAPTDIDGNGKVVVLFSPKVNDLSDPTENSIVTGFFLPLDLADNGDGEGGGTTADTCPAGDEAELLYLLAPDPEGTRDADSVSAERAQQIARGTASHEFQHLLNAGNRVIDQNGSFFDLEETWLDEALSHVAEEVVGFAREDKTLRSNFSAGDAGNGGTASEQETFDTFHRSNLGRLQRYLAEPASTRALAVEDPGGSESLKMRGFAWIFARWLADQETSGSAGQVPGTGDPEQQVFRDLAKADGGNLDAGVDNVEGVTGRQWGDLLAEFAPMPAVDDDVTGLTGAHRLLTWNMRQIYESFPLAFESTGFATDSFDFTVQAGGTKHVFVGSSGSAPGVTIELTDQSGTTLTTGEPQITVVRTR